MRLVSLNINGIQSAWNNRLKQYVRQSEADIFCMQETRTGKDLYRFFIPEYHEFFCPSMRPGYAGVALYTKLPPKLLIQGIGNPDRAEEGRAITIETRDFFLVNVYAPASGANLERLPNKLLWMQDLTRFVCYLETKKPVIICGDMNVAASRWDAPVDERSAGNTDEERRALGALVECGYVDIWRFEHGHEHGVTWAPYALSERNPGDIGWRLDYFLVSEKLLDRIRTCYILPFNEISDHRAVVLDIK